MTYVAPSAPQVIAVARHFKGVRESPAGSNCQRFGVWYGMNCVRWCAIFESYCLYVAGYRFSDASTRKGFSYCPAIYAWGKKHGRVSRTPHLGDLALHLNSSGVPHHTEIVTKVMSTAFMAIGGNTSASGSLSNGGEVVEHQHPRDRSWVFVSPFYSKTGNSVPTSTTTTTNPIHRNIGLTSPLTGAPNGDADIKWAQGRLNALGFPCGTPDGIYGPVTAKAVYNFQVKHGLVHDSVLGPVTGYHLSIGH